jgi:uncharacterized protein with FMN-binding domain
MSYKITQEIKAKAKAIGVTVKPSTRKGKKLDAYKDGEYQASFGATGYKDYHIHKAEKGESYANERRRLYHIRHKDEAPKMKDGKLTASYLAKKVLW